MYLMAYNQLCTKSSLDNHGDLTAAYGNSCEASPILAETPHKWAVGTTFEWEFDFPITTNPAYEAKPAPKRKTRTSANPNAVSSRACKTSKPATVQTAKPKRVRLTPDEQRERTRARAVENRRKLKELSICKDCRKPAAPGQVRCSSCADKHRKSWKPRTSKGKDQDNVMN